MTRAGWVVAAISVIQVAVVVLFVVVVRRARAHGRRVLDVATMKLIAPSPPRMAAPPPSLGPVPSTPLHAYQLTTADRALIEVLAGASFAPRAMVRLPSGLMVSGAELSRWVAQPARSHTSQQESS